MKYKAETVGTKEVVEGYYGIKGKDTDLEQHCIMESTLSNNSIPNFYFTDYVINPSTLQIKLTNGEWANVEDVEFVVKKAQLFCNVEGGVCPYETGDRKCRAKFECTNQVLTRKQKGK